MRLIDSGMPGGMGWMFVLESNVDIGFGESGVCFWLIHASHSCRDVLYSFHVIYNSGIRCKTCPDIWRCISIIMHMKTLTMEH